MPGLHTDAHLRSSTQVGAPSHRTCPLSPAAAVILALRDIQAGEEITIAYVDEVASVEERAAELADYGFTCDCDKCCAERLAGELLLD